MQVPKESTLPTNVLAACFNNTVATYKFYWFLSIIQSVEAGQTKILKQELFARMIANAWFTVNYFRVSFGKQDKLQRAIELIKDYECLMIDEDREKIFQTLKNTKNPNTLSELKYFNNQVPHWFLSPWFPKLPRAEIYTASQKYLNQSLYGLSNDAIVVNPAWSIYLVENARVLKDFCYWNLVMFLQAKNPSVPDLSNKLIKPASRNSLVKQRIQFWDVVVKELGSVDCIYTGEKLTIGNYAVEHFIPYSFVSHDLIWNLIPADKSFNSSKSNRLPPLEKYFIPFFELQETAISIVKNKNPNNRLLEDYLTILPNVEEHFTMEKFKETIEPLITIASTNGFEFLK